MKQLVLSVAFLISATFTFSQGCIELFISEYVEGFGNNKAIELYNPTSTAKNLANYRLERFSNGSSNSAANQRLVLEGTIQPYSTFVIVIDKRNPEGTGQEQPVWLELQAKADLFACPIYDENNTMYFNGNDAMVLRNISGGGNGFVIDVFGRIGEDPGNPSAGGGWNNVPPAFTWVANGSTAWTTNHSMIRKQGITIGDLNGADPFDAGLEWDSIPPTIMGPEGFIVGNWESLGSHSCVCDPTLSIVNADKASANVYPNPARAGQQVWYTAATPMIGYELIDLTGKVAVRKIVPALTQFEVSTEGLRTGIYLLRTFDEYSSYTRKLIIQ